LITAARRRFDSWDKALTAAGLDYKKIVLRTRSSAVAPLHQEQTVMRIHCALFTQATEMLM